jgi:hypothetical protein
MNAPLGAAPERIWLTVGAVDLRVGIDDEGKSAHGVSGNSDLETYLAWALQAGAVAYRQPPALPGEAIEALSYCDLGLAEASLSLYAGLRSIAQTGKGSQRVPSFQVGTSCSFSRRVIAPIGTLKVVDSTRIARRTHLPAILVDRQRSGGEPVWIPPVHVPPYLAIRTTTPRPQTP